jgi:hypothetical protein
MSAPIGQETLGRKLVFRLGLDRFSMAAGASSTNRTFCANASRSDGEGHSPTYRWGADVLTAAAMTNSQQFVTAQTVKAPISGIRTNNPPPHSAARLVPE